MNKHLYTLTLLLMALCLHSVAQTKSGLNPQRFKTTVDGKETKLITLHNGDMEACITNYGARLVSLMVPDKEGKVEDVVLGFDNIEAYRLKKQNFGSIVGRYIGRIKGAHFTLDGQEYQLQQTGSGNISHGGQPGFSDRVWDIISSNDSTLRLRYVSPDGENGFPGTLTTIVTYRLTYDCALTVSFEATTDKPTVVNLSNHTFFNISVCRQQIHRHLRQAEKPGRAVHAGTQHAF